MPRNTSGEFYFPVGTAAVAGETAYASDVNARFDALKDDANQARPVSAGGTGAITPFWARANLGALGLSGGVLTGTLDAPQLGVLDNNGTMRGRLTYSPDDDTVRLRWVDAQGSNLRQLGLGVNGPLYGALPIVHSGITAGAVGQYAFLRSNVTVQFGGAVSGAQLSPAGAGNAVDPVTPQPGTWRCLGYVTAGGSTLFQRIS